MEIATSQNEIQTNTAPYQFISQHGGTISSNKRAFSGSWLIDPGPCYARCQPLGNIPMDSYVDVPDGGTAMLPAQIVFKIITKAHKYADCSVGIHTNVDKYFTHKKSRIGYEISVHGHRVRGLEGRRFGRRVETEDPTKLKEIKNVTENTKDWIDKEWADGDIIKLVFTNPTLKWF